MADAPQYWFYAKRYGWGWGLPSCWQGWLVLATYVVSLLLTSLLVSSAVHPWLFYGAVGACSAIFLAVCWYRGEPLRGRWGK
ncbi:hypothetical protein HZU75_00505 [Chitinibacter fontanus]|uniref:DUF4175 domain-containing protein n=1 Tax=Chitinibacter fontanus TaxID=1737446 RepID=A0A7D5V7I2_9NEIS|nr:hypothetical protein [Chitinibacter fontanus]QLI80139.1 hypothetical protein HZU75_00505 [Chitinibacter fontanus]